MEARPYGVSAGSQAPFITSLNQAAEKRCSARKQFSFNLSKQQAAGKQCRTRKQMAAQGRIYAICNRRAAMLLTRLCVLCRRPAGGRANAFPPFFSEQATPRRDTAEDIRAMGIYPRTKRQRTTLSFAACGRPCCSIPVLLAKKQRARRETAGAQTAMGIYPRTKRQCATLSLAACGRPVLFDSRLALPKKQSPAVPRQGIAFLEQAMGIEPTRPAWKAGVLPLNYACTMRRLPAHHISFPVYTAATRIRGLPKNVK